MNIEATLSYSKLQRKRGLLRRNHGVRWHVVTWTPDGLASGTHLKRINNPVVWLSSITDISVKRASRSLTGFSSVTGDRSACPTAPQGRRRRSHDQCLCDQFAATPAVLPFSQGLNRSAAHHGVRRPSSPRRLALQSIHRHMHMGAHRWCRRPSGGRSRSCHDCGGKASSSQIRRNAGAPCSLCYPQQWLAGTVGQPDITRRSSIINAHAARVKRLAPHLQWHAAAHSEVCVHPGASLHRAYTQMRQRSHDRGLLRYADAGCQSRGLDGFREVDDSKPVGRDWRSPLVTLRRVPAHDGRKVRMGLSLLRLRAFAFRAQAAQMPM